MISVKSQVYKRRNLDRNFSSVQEIFKSIIPIVLDKRTTTLPSDSNNLESPLQTNPKQLISPNSLEESSKQLDMIDFLFYLKL